MPVSLSFRTLQIATQGNKVNAEELQRSLLEIQDALLELQDLQLLKSRRVSTDSSANPDELLLVDPFNAAVTITLPVAADNDRAQCIIKNTTGSTNTITIEAQPGETIDGAATTSISSARGVVNLIADKVNKDWMTVI